MATARQILQQEIFDQCDQKLLAFVGVNNDMKKKKFGYLCLSDTKEPPSNIYIHQVYYIVIMNIIMCLLNCYKIYKNAFIFIFFA